eukprot:TRINITY_DN1282_c0_g1_i1.p1 TRINITY_DN1282_c0_g1~~TRINITY_DN1282_c0_g1_i1.p1  ORF type:complete len:673 (-),score=260.51 TRINITY_DN1282_c0_g1_i1:238-2256(-)
MFGSKTSPHEGRRKRAETVTERLERRLQPGVFGPGVSENVARGEGVTFADTVGGSASDMYDGGSVRSSRTADSGDHLDSKRTASSAASTGRKRGQSRYAGIRRPDGAISSSHLSSMEDRIQALMRENDELREALRMRQSTYRRKQEEYEKEINTLKEQLNSAVLSRTDSEKRMQSLHKINTSIQDGIDTMQVRMHGLVQEREGDLRRVFRAQLKDIEGRLEEEKRKSAHGAREYVERIEKLTQDLRWMKDEATRLDTMNHKLIQENKRLRVQFAAQEDDRSIMAKHVASLKLDVTRSKDEVSRLEERVVEGVGGTMGEGVGSTSARGRITTAAGARSQQRGTIRPSTTSTASSSRYKGNGVMFAADGTEGEADGEGALGGGGGEAWRRRSEEMIRRLRKQLEGERANLRALRSAHIQLLSERSEMEMFLRQCIDDVREEMATLQRTSVRARKSASGSLSMRVSTSGSGSASTRKGRRHSMKSQPAPLQDLREWGAGERERVIELLLSKESVLSLLYEKTFPQRKHMLPRETLEHSTGHDIMDGGGIGRVSGMSGVSSSAGSGLRIGGDGDGGDGGDVDGLWKQWKAFTEEADVTVDDYDGDEDDDDDLDDGGSMGDDGSKGGAIAAERRDVMHEDELRMEEDGKEEALREDEPDVDVMDASKLEHVALEASR